MYYQLTAIITILLVLLPGCTSIREFDEPKFKKLKAGEVVTVFQRDGRVQVMEVIEVSADQIRGRVDGSSTLTTVDVQDIETVRVERTDYVLSGAAFVGGVVGLAAVSLLGLVMLVGAGA